MLCPALMILVIILATILVIVLATILATILVLPTPFVLCTDREPH